MALAARRRTTSATRRQQAGLGNIAKCEWQDDKYGTEQIPAITLRLAKPTSDGDEYATLLARSKQMQRVIGRAAKCAGATGDGIGNWLSVTFIEKRETSNGEMKWYEAEYKLATPRTDAPIGVGELGEVGDDDTPPF